MSRNENLKILVIDDNFLIREVIKSELLKLGKEYSLKFKFYSASNGLQGLGYLYTVEPDLVIVDSTLPKYSGKEVVDFIASNPRFARTKIISLTEKDKDIEKLMAGVHRQLLLHKHPGSTYKKIHLASAVINLANKGDLIQHKIEKRSRLIKIFTFPIWLVLEIITTAFFAIYSIKSKRAKDSDIQQKKKDVLNFRVRVYPALAVLFVSAFILLIKYILFLGTTLGFITVVNEGALAASYTWDGGGSTNNWSECANWSSDICPLAADTVTFNGTSTKNAVIDASFQGTVSAFTISSGYTGTITAQRTLVVNGGFAQSGGTFNGSNQTLDFNSILTLNSGSNFTATSGTMTIADNITINSGATFNHNNGTVTFDGVNVATFTCNNATFNLVNLTGTTNTKTVGSDCTFPLGNNPTVGRYSINGTLTGSGTLTFSGSSTWANTAVMSGFTAMIANAGITNNGATLGSITSFTSASTLTVAGTWNAGNYTLFDANSSFVLNSGAVFTAPSGTMSVASTFTISSGATFNHNNGTITFDGNSGITITCNNTTFNLVTFNHTTNPKTVASDCNLPIGSNPTIPFSIILNGTFTGTGTLTTTANNQILTFNSGSSLSGFTTLNGANYVNNGASLTGITSITAAGTITVAGTWDTSTYSVFDANGAFTLNSGGVFTAPVLMTVQGAFTINSGATFNHNNGTLTFDGTSGVTISCNNATFNVVTFNHTTNAKTVASNCNLPIGSNPTLPFSIILNGTLTGTGTLTTTANNQTLTLNSGSSLSGFTTLNGANYVNNGASLSGITSITAAGVITVAGTWDTSAYSLFDANSSFVLNSGAVFTAPSLMTVQGAFTINSGATFNHNNGTLTFDGTSGVTISCNNATFNLITFNHSTNTKTVASNCTLPLGNNPTIPFSVSSSGAFTGTGTLTATANNQILTLNSGSTISGFTTLNTNIFTNTGTLTGLSSFSALGAVTVASTWNAGAYTTFDINSTFTLNSGANFTAPSGTATFASTFTINSGATFNHNNGTVTFDGLTSVTLSCNNAVFNLVTFAHTAFTKTVSSNCTFPLGNNPTIPNFGALTVNGTLTGTGAFTIAAQLTLNTGATMSGFTSLSTAGFTQNGTLTGVTSFSASGAVTSTATWNASSYTTFDANSNLVLNSGANFTAPSGDMTVAGNFTINTGATFNHNNGTLIFDGSTTATLNCNNQTFNSVELFKTSGTFVINSTCSLPIGVDPTITTTELNGTLTGSGDLTVISQDSGTNATFTMNPGSALNCFDSITADPFRYNGGDLCGLSVSQTWDGEGTDGTCGGAAGDGNKWSCALNWSSDEVPGPLDAVTFNSTSTKDSVIDTGFSGEILNITIASGYTGTITQDRSLEMQGFYSQSDGTFVASDDDITLQTTFTQSGGTFTGGSGNLDIGTSFVLNTGANFTSPSGTLIVTNTFTINTGVSFSHNNGTINLTTAGTATVTCNNAVFNLVEFKFRGIGLVAATKTISTGCTLPLGNDPIVEGHITLNGTLTGTGTYKTGYFLTLNNGSGFTGFTGFDSVIGPTPDSVGSGMTLGTSKVFDASTYNTFVVGGVINFLASSNFTAPAEMYVGRSWVMGSSSPIFNHNNGTVYFTNPHVPVASASIFCSGQVFNSIVFTHTSGHSKTFTAQSGGGTCTAPLGHNPVINGDIRLGRVSGDTSKGNFSGTGTLTVNATFTVGDTGWGRFTGFDKIAAKNLIWTRSDSTSFTKIEVMEDFTLNTDLNGTSHMTQIDVGDDLIINSAGILTAPPNLTIGGDFSHTDGTFDHNNGTVEFVGSADKTILGNTTFNNLKFAPFVDPNLFFTAGTTQTILGALTLKGQPGELVYLKSTTPGDEWSIDVKGTYDIQQVHVTDSIALTTTLDVGCKAIDGGNNTNWVFSTECSPSIFSLGPAENVSGESIDSNQPTLTFSISDPDSWDVVKYTIEIDNNSDFSSPEVCYTSAFASPGAFSFTVGQAAGTGAYTCGSEGQTLDAGEYYWRVIATDSVGYTSGHKTANSGNIAFKVVAPFGTDSYNSFDNDTDPDDPFNTEPDLPEIIENTPLNTEELPETGKDNSIFPEGFFDIKRGDLVITIPVILSIVIPAAILSVAIVGAPLLSSFALKDVLFRIYAIPAALLKKKRKSWGLIYDEIDNQGVSFAVIDLLSESESLITHTTSDLKGRYGFLIDKKGKYFLEVRAEGYETKRISLNIDGNELIEDIAMTKIGGKKNVLNRFLFYSKSKLITVVNIILIASLTFGLLFSIYLVILKLSLFNLIMLAFYILAVLFNIILFITRIEKESGQIVDISTKKGIKGTIARIYGKDRQLDVVITNSEGKIKANIKPGEYLITATKPGYIQTQESAIVSISENGFMDKEIQMRKHGNSSPTPFS